MFLQFSVAFFNQFIILVKTMNFNLLQKALKTAENSKTLEFVTKVSAISQHKIIAAPYLVNSSKLLVDRTNISND